MVRDSDARPGKVFKPEVRGTVARPVKIILAPGKRHSCQTWWVFWPKVRHTLAGPGAVLVDTLLLRIT